MGSTVQPFPHGCQHARSYSAEKGKESASLFAKIKLQRACCAKKHIICVSLFPHTPHTPDHTINTDTQHYNIQITAAHRSNAHKSWLINVRVCLKARKMTFYSGFKIHTAEVCETLWPVRIMCNVTEVTFVIQFKSNSFMPVKAIVLSKHTHNEKEKRKCVNHRRENNQHTTFLNTNSNIQVDTNATQLNSRSVETSCTAM